ncbi:MAG TPA: GTP cyclohydrolase II [Rhizomicrobium sp.]|jgi:GTP cyclohydrolase II|nr:GTP cyclohydrolase II [Rhizomicrobium sp.]
MPLPHDRKPVAGPETAGQALAQVARAVDAFRAGSFVQLVEGAAEGVAALAVETASEAALNRFAAASPLLVLTHARARTLKIRLYTPDIVAVPLAAPLNPRHLHSIADPMADLAEPLKGPFQTLRGSLPNAYSAAVRLAKLGGLLPAVIAGPALVAPVDSVEVPVAAITGYDQLVVDSLKLITRARVPLEGAEPAELVAFRAGCGEPEHYAILIGDPPRDRPVLARLHSECFTGDLLGSLRCDCGAQLRGAIEAIAKAGGGVLLYLAQEGRGIGLINKLRAYRLQDQGFDTMDANARLGFESDERLFGIAARMLTLLGFRFVRLLTNNPHKIEALKSAGIEVTERVPHAFPANNHNRVYLRTKAEKAGHLF